jgi:hypothetical protein
MGNAYNKSDMGEEPFFLCFLCICVMCFCLLYVCVCVCVCMFRRMQLIVFGCEHVENNKNNRKSSSDIFCEIDSSGFSKND